MIQGIANIEINAIGSDAGRRVEKGGTAGSVTRAGNTRSSGDSKDITRNDFHPADGVIIAVGYENTESIGCNTKRPVKAGRTAEAISRTGISGTADYRGHRIGEDRDNPLEASPSTSGTMKEVDDPLVPFEVVTVMGPEVAPGGTVATIWVASALTIVAWIPLNLTISLSAAGSKRLPLMVTCVPTTPLAGENPDTTGFLRVTLPQQVNKMKTGTQITRHITLQQFIVKPPSK